MKQSDSGLYFGQKECYFSIYYKRESNKMTDMIYYLDDETVLLSDL